VSLVNVTSEGAGLERALMGLDGAVGVASRQAQPKVPGKIKRRDARMVLLAKRPGIFRIARPSRSAHQTKTPGQPPPPPPSQPHPPPPWEGRRVGTGGVRGARRGVGG